MAKLDKVCVKAARVYRTLNKPIIRSKVDAGFDLYPGEDADRPVVSLKVKDIPEVKLLDLVLAVCAVKIVYSAIKGIIDLFE